MGGCALVAVHKTFKTKNERRFLICIAGAIVIIIDVFFCNDQYCYYYHCYY